MKIAIIGAGAVGSVVAGVLARGGLDVRLIERNAKTVAHIAAHGLRLEGVRGSYVVRLPIHRDAPTADSVDLAVFCVKAYDTAAAAEQHAALCAGGALAMSLQNGVGNVESLAARYGDERLLAGSTTLAAHVLAPGVVQHAADGETVIGEARGGLTPRLREIAAAWTAAGLPARAVGDIREALWAKLCVNAAINPVAALLGVRNGELARAASLRPLLEDVVREAVAAAAALGVTLDAAAVIARLWQVIADTRDIRASMLGDLAAGGRTEIDAINGAVAAVGRARGLPTPVNDALTRLVQAAVERSRASDGA